MTKLSTHSLIKLQTLTLEAKLWEHELKPPTVDLALHVSAITGNRSIGVYSAIEAISLSDLLGLADQLQLASIQVRSLAAEIDPGRRFEADQAAAFALDRVEDGEVANEP